MESHVKAASAQKQQRLNLAAPPRSQPRQRQNRLRGAALGLVSVESFPAVIGIADAMTKAAEVFLVGYEKTGGGHCTAVIRGGVANVRLAVEAGVAMAQEFGQEAFSTVIPRPLPNLEAVLPICAHLEHLEQLGQGRSSSQAVGLLETRGFPAMVGAADAMTKSADVQLMSHETIGSGLCTILIRGSLPNVAIAIEAGMAEAERIGELSAVMIVPRPLEDLEQSLPQQQLEQTPEQPIRIPLSLQDKEKEMVELPDTQEQEKEMADQMPLPDLEAIPAEPLEDSQT
ncbi:carbon dioxide concentrating mechanism/carboxysome shell protein [filamentous cyanobacterium CCP5]|nr:carbon dioxide concentrating mechanism/carboxysome shell protein [filamentous cyanobacterium CCP5]